MSNGLINWFRYASPQSFYPLAGKMIPWFWALTAVFGIAGLWLSFFVAPTDAVQGEGYRIIFIHVPGLLPNSESLVITTLPKIYFIIMPTAAWFHTE